MNTFAAPRAKQRLGRFELLRELGRGAQARVWLAHDTRLERDVALKMLDPSADAAELSEWLHEARAVSRLTHPNIVPVFEADEADGQPYLVFEFVDGSTLGEERRRRPRWQPREAVELLLGVLDALAAAHDKGIVHRDLKPSNVLLGRDGRARVMDFGIAAHVAARSGVGTDGSIVGTPGYMSPEAARGEAPHTAMDVFAAGVLLGELLAGEPLMRECDPWRYVERVQKEDLTLPETTRVDSTLRGIVQRALARDLRTRYDGARSMHAALAAWLAPVEAPAPQASHATLEFLLRRMRHKTDFPALSDSVLRIQRVAASETANISVLSEEILRDVALTNKLLRMVNSAYFSSAAGGSINTVSRAVSLVGFAGIRNMALSVLLLEHMQDKAHAAHLREEFVRALMAGTMAAELVPWQRESEQAFLGSMFQNLGRLLTEYYFPEEALQIRKMLPDPFAPHAQREAAALRVLGIGLNDLGTGVARAWGLPDSLQHAMRVPSGDPPKRAPRGDDHVRWLGCAANGLTDALLQHEDGDGHALLHDVAHRYAGILELPATKIVGAAQTARGRMTQLATAMGLHMPRGARSQRLLTTLTPADDEGAAPTVVTPREGAAASESTTATLTTGMTVTTAVTAAATLQVTLQDMGRALDERSMRLNELLSLVLETMHRVLKLRAVVLCLRDPRGVLHGRYALGPLVAAKFNITPRPAGDLFAVACHKGADLHVANAATVADKLPPWYRHGVAAGSFLLLPLMVKGSPIGLIYGDKVAANGLAVSELELELLRGLRDKLVVAFQRGG